MIFDWDLWPGLIAYESDWGQLERFRRGVVAVSEAMRSFGVTAGEAALAVGRFREALLASLLSGRRHQSRWQRIRAWIWRRRADSNR